MTKFSIEYNPYLVKCVFKKNGKVLNAKSKIGAKSEERLQVLLGESVNWKGLLEEIAIACDDDEVEIHFKGRKIDFDDLKYTLNMYKGTVQFSTTFEESTNDADVIGGLDKIFDEIRSKDIAEFNQKNKDGLDIFDAYEEAKNGIFEVSVIATMSSGKSTLINSILHTELLPSSNAACTATIARIFDNDDMDGFEAECYAADGKTVIHPKGPVDLSKMSEYNADKNVTYIDIVGNIPSISDDKIQLCLRDTPGPNNSQNENHGRLTRSIIKRTNAVILYVMNATQIGIKDDKQLLMDISSEMKRAGKQSRDRFIFVINKCDEIDEEKGENVEKTLSEVRDYLKKEFDIVEPTLIPTSARLALAIRKSKKGEKLSKNERKALVDVEDFVNNELLHYEKFATLTPTVREKLQLQAAKYHKDEELWDDEALIHTGVPAVEETISEYVEKYAYPMKIKDAIKDIVAILGELNMKAEFAKSIANDSKKLTMVRKQIADAKKKHRNGKKIYDVYKAKIGDFRIDEKVEDNEQYSVEMKLQEILKKYDDKEKVDKREADILLVKFQDDLVHFQRDCESSLNRNIAENIFKEGKKMLAEYTSVVRQILDNIEIEGYDFQKLKSFHEIKISDISELKKRNESVRYRKEKRWIKNPEREGFFGFFKFFEPKEISVLVDVRDGVDVDVKEIIVNVMTGFSSSIKENIHTVFEQAYDQIEEYKNAFNDNIDTLDNEIDRILDELDKSTAELGDLEQRVKENKKLSKWVRDKETRIKTLLDF
ncbi:MAG: dynamin family protein [Lachnospiraceae bacterium]|nr:dynamin family protein [Lachnospiraceae bacterium]